jgi:hypothetical protein
MAKTRAEEKMRTERNGLRVKTGTERDRAGGTRARRGHKRGQELQLIANARAKLYGGVGVSIASRMAREVSSHGAVY